MLKKLFLGSVLLSTSLLSQAGIIKLVTGADMAGISVTATFADSTAESFLWNTISTTLGTTGNDIIDHEGFSGGVFGADWSLTQQGYTLGEAPNGNILGAWTFTDNRSTGKEITSLVIDGTNVDIVFDTVTLSNSDIDTNGSGQGRYIDANAGLLVGTYSNPYLDELYSTLTIDFTVPGTSFQFMADTDQVTVSEPATALIFLSGLLALVNIRRKS